MSVMAPSGDRWKAGAAILRRLDVSAPCFATQPTRVLSVRVPTSFRNADPERLRGVGSWSLLPDAASDDLRRLHRELNAATEDTMLLEALALLAVNWGERTIRRPMNEAVRHSWMPHILERLSELAQPHSLRQLAEETRINSAHLARTFRQVHGCTTGEYQRRLRIAAACRMLQRRQATLSRVALATGFTDQAHFSRVFKRLTGVTPREYRSSANRRTNTVAGIQLPFDPVGTYEFRSRTADGRPYEGVVEITGSADGYGGIARTSVMPDVPIDTVAIRGSRMLITALVPAGVAVIQLNFDGMRFTGSWRLAGKGTELRGQKSR